MRKPAPAPRPWETPAAACHGIRTGAMFFIAAYLAIATPLAIVRAGKETAARCSATVDESLKAELAKVKSDGGQSTHPVNDVYRKSEQSRIEPEKFTWQDHIPATPRAVAPPELMPPTPEITEQLPRPKPRPVRRRS